MLDLRIMDDGRARPVWDLPAYVGRQWAAREISDTIEALIAFLDDLGGDPDLEDDDPAGDPLDIGEYDEAALLEPPRYGVDQTLGPVNEREAIAAYERRLT